MRILKTFLLLLIFTSIESFSVASSAPMLDHDARQEETDRLLDYCQKIAPFYDLSEGCDLREITA